MPAHKLTILLAILLLTACGQKGPLYLPQAPTAELESTASETETNAKDEQ